MFVGVLQFEVLVHGSTSLKDKRSVVRSIKDRLHREHQVSVAEVGAHDSLVRAVLGLCMVAKDPARCHQVLDAVTGKLRGLVHGELGACSRSVFAGQLIDEDAEAETLEPVTNLEARMLAELDSGEEERA